jgi:hypothetical protein
MINPAEIIDALVSLLRDIPELVDEVGGDPERIFAYHDRYPRNVSLEMARYEMPSPSVMVAYQGTGPGSFGTSEVWKHEISISLRAREEADEGAAPAGYYRLFRLITKGVPASVNQSLNNATVHASCQPMDTPAMRRQTDAAGVDYFEIAMSFTEIGDE